MVEDLFSSRYRFALIASALLACQAGVDQTYVEAETYSAAADTRRRAPSDEQRDPSSPGDDEAGPAPGASQTQDESASSEAESAGSQLTETETGSLSDSAGADAGAVEPEPPPSFAAPCFYQLVWSEIELSSPECGCDDERCGWFRDAALSASSAHWDGQILSLFGGSAPFAGAELERMRMCRVETARWRFDERLVLHELPSAEGCTTPLTASYEYHECPFLNGTSGVCGREPRSAANEKYYPEGNACHIRARATLMPFAAAGDAGVGPPPTAACVPFTAFGGTIDQPVPIGEPCYSTLHCEAGAYCSRAQADLSCSSQGTCVAAPSVAECDDTIEEVPTCNGGCLRTLPSHGDEPANACKVQAIQGLDTFPGSCAE